MPISRIRSGVGSGVRPGVRSAVGAGWSSVSSVPSV